MKSISLIFLLFFGVKAEYDYGGWNYTRQKAERLIVGTSMLKTYDKMLQVFNDALTAGYRTFDTAQLYENEPIVGQVLNEILPKHGLKRDQIFVVSKVRPENQGARAYPSILESLKKLNLGYIDLMLIHWPFVDPNDPLNPHHHQIVRKETWKALEKYYKSGQLKAIGVSNYLPHHLDDLLSYATVYPAVDESENSLTYQTNDLVEYCERKKILFWAYTCQLRPDRTKVLDADPKLVSIAEKYKITPKMVEFAYSLSRGMHVVLGATSTDHIKQNRDLLNVNLSPEDSTALKLPAGTTGQKSVCDDPKWVIY